MEYSSWRKEVMQSRDENAESLKGITDGWLDKLAFRTGRGTDGPQEH